MKLGMHTQPRLAYFLGLTLSLLASSLIACGGDEAIDEPEPMEEPEPSEPTPNAGCSIDTGVPHVEVILHDQAGAVVDFKYADSEGIAAWDSCPDTAMVSFAASANGGITGVTLTGIEPGDHFALSSIRLGIVAAADVEIPEDGADLQNVRVSAGPGCSGGTSEGATKSLLLTTTCVNTSDGKLPVLATAKKDDSRFYSYSTEASIDMEGMLIDDLGGWTVGPYLQLSIDNATGPGVLFSLTGLRNGVPYASNTESTGLIDGGASVGLSSPPSGFVTSRMLGAAIPAIDGYQGVVLHTKDLGASFDGSSIPAEITAAELIDGDSPRPTMSISGGPVDSEIEMRVLGWSAQDMDVLWYVVSPGQSGSVTFPDFPDHLADLAPVNATYGGAVVIDVDGETFRSIFTAGYALGEHFQGCPDLPLGGSCRYSVLEL
jgi:hypothetical protein